MHQALQHYGSTLDMTWNETLMGLILWNPRSRLTAMAATTPNFSLYVYLYHSTSLYIPFTEDPEHNADYVGCVADGEESLRIRFQEPYRRILLYFTSDTVQQPWSWKPRPLPVTSVIIPAETRLNAIDTSIVQTNMFAVRHKRIQLKSKIVLSTPRLNQIGFLPESSSTEAAHPAKAQ
jgi:hypothetical protein